MQIELTAKPLQFNTDSLDESEYCEWTDTLMGFHITYEPSEPIESRFAAAWGEGDTEHFSTLDEAKAWCQAEADGWVKDCAQATVTGEPNKHVYWGAGEPECPREIKAPNGELHTLRCKVCGKDNPQGMCAV